MSMSNTEKEVKDIRRSNPEMALIQLTAKPA
jgi:hypothetical protein